MWEYIYPLFIFMWVELYLTLYLNNPYRGGLVHWGELKFYYISTSSYNDAALRELDEDGEEPEGLEMEDGNEVDPAVQLSDSAMVDDVAAETDMDDSLPQLTQEQNNIG